MEPNTRYLARKLVFWRENGTEIAIFVTQMARKVMKIPNRRTQQTRLLELLQQEPNGLSRSEIEQDLDEPISTRTLIRRLEELLGQGLIQTSGVGRSLRYYLVKKDIASADSDLGVPIPLTEEARAILQTISRPEHLLTPVPYHREFLESYKPNVDYYLTKEQRDHLRTIGNRTLITQTAGTYVKQVFQRLLIDLSWNSSRLEGNTYSLLDTERLLAEGRAAENKSALEAQMILNHKDAIEFLVRRPDEIAFDRYTISNIHALLSNNLLPDPAAPGRLRIQPVGIKKSVYIPTAIPQHIEELFSVVLEKTSAIADPFEQAFFIMVHIPYLQPFDDVNKRVSRLAANIPFIRDNLAPLSFTDVPNDLYIQGLLAVYELNRIELLRDVFIWAYERSAARYDVIRQTIGEPDPFKLQHRKIISELVSQVITDQMPREIATAFILRRSMALPSEDQERLRRAVNIELNSLHEGNIARYWVRPSEFATWKQQWDTAKT